MGLVRRVHNMQYRLVAELNRFSKENAITIFSEPRGGSTWLTQMIQTIPRSSVIWEPLHLEYNRRIKEIGFSWRQYIPETENWPEAKHEIDAILSGKVLNANIGFLNKPWDYPKAEQLIVKFCRGNALLPWFVRQYKLKYKPVYLVRHPFSVVASQLLQGGWNEEFFRFDIPQSKFSNVYKQHESFLNGIRTKEESLLAVWCLTNSIPLNHQKNNLDWITIFYEDLVKDPMNQLVSIFNKWGIKMPNEIEERIDISSKTTVTEVKKDHLAQLSKWKGQFSNEQVQRLLEVLEYFQITSYNEGILPVE